MPTKLKKIILLTCLIPSLWVQLGRADESVNESTERIIWDKHPLKITLPVDKERIISFPSPVKFWMPDKIQSRLRTQINSNEVYLLANEAFQTQRIQIKAVDGSTFYLVDLQAKIKGASNEPIEVILKKPDHQNNRVNNDHESHAIPKKSPGYILLTRFAAQQLYSPARLLSTPQGVHRVPVNRRIITHLIHGIKVNAKPIASWRFTSLYVTAIELKNQTQKYITLDPRMIRGHWKSATFQHVRLHPIGSESDTSALYLISNRPFHEVI